MSRIKLIQESVLTNGSSEEYPDVKEVILPNNKPDYSILDITVIPDDLYNPTIQSILISLDEDAVLKESDSKNLDINILSETVNAKTGYSNSLFEFESSDSTITLSLVLQETERKGVYTVEAYTTRGIKVFETHTLRPKETIKNYLNSLASEYLISKPITEADGDLAEVLKDDVKTDLNIEPGSDEEQFLDEVYSEPSEEDEVQEETTNEEIVGDRLANKIIENELKIDYSDWNQLDKDEREARVEPKLRKFIEDNKDIFKSSVMTYIYFIGAIEDASLDTEKEVLEDLYDEIVLGR